MAPSSPFDALGGERYVRLSTFRKSGAAVPTPVWFARLGENLYVVTGRNTGKVKRIRNNPDVTLAPSDFGGRPKASGEDPIRDRADPAPRQVASLDPLAVDRHEAMLRRAGEPLAVFGFDVAQLRREPRRVRARDRHVQRVAAG